MTNRTVVLALLCYTVAGCATFRPAPGSPAAVIRQLDADNLVRVTNHHGETLELANVRLVGDSLVGVRSVATAERFSISLQDIQSLDIGREHVVGTVLLVLVALAGALYILMMRVGYYT